MDTIDYLFFLAEGLDFGRAKGITTVLGCQVKLANFGRPLPALARAAPIGLEELYRVPGTGA